VFILVLFLLHLYFAELFLPFQPAKSELFIISLIVKGALSLLRHFSRLPGAAVPKVLPPFPLLLLLRVAGHDCRPLVDEMGVSGVDSFHRMMRGFDIVLAVFSV
jgi:hypothetical protein